MGIRLLLLKKEHIQLPCFGWTLKVCLVFIVLTFTSSMACGGGGNGAGTTEAPELIESEEEYKVNLTGIKDLVERNIKAGWNGWEPSDETKEHWKNFYMDYKKELEMNGEFPWNYKGDTGPYGTGNLSYKDFAHERGPGSGWPDLPGWADLGAGNGGTPVPPWAYGPKNIGKPTLCYLSPLRGTCSRGTKPKPAMRWGYNPFIDECKTYEWSGCGGSRNKFLSKGKCEKVCMSPAPPACTYNSGILDTTKRKPIT